jgi:hypothetical protein
MIDSGRPKTPFFKFGERISMQSHIDGAFVSPFGVLDQQVVQSGG